jgi:hypothetical protein
MSDHSEYTNAELSEAIAEKVMGECVHKNRHASKKESSFIMCPDCDYCWYYDEDDGIKPYAEDRNHAIDALEKWMQSNPSHNYQIGDIGRKDGFKYIKLYLGANTLADVDNESLARAICLALLQAVRA